MYKEIYTYLCTTNNKSCFKFIYENYRISIFLLKIYLHPILLRSSSSKEVRTKIFNMSFSFTPHKFILNIFISIIIGRQNKTRSITTNIILERKSILETSQAILVNDNFNMKKISYKCYLTKHLKQTKYICEIHHALKQKMFKYHLSLNIIEEVITLDIIKNNLISVSKTFIYYCQHTKFSLVKFIGLCNHVIYKYTI